MYLIILFGLIVVDRLRHRKRIPRLKHSNGSSAPEHNIFAGSTLWSIRDQIASSWLNNKKAVGRIAMDEDSLR